MATVDRACAPASRPVLNSPAPAPGRFHPLPRHPGHDAGHLLPGLQPGRHRGGRSGRRPGGRRGLLGRPLAAVALAAAVPLVVAGAAGAAPPPSQTSAGVAAQVRSLQHQADVLVEAYDRNAVALAAATRKAAAASAAAQAQQRHLVSQRAALGSLAAAAYQSGSGGAGTVATLLASPDPQHFLDRAVSLSAVAYDAQARITRFAALQAAYDAAHAAASADLAEQRGLQRDLAARRARIEAALIRQEQLLSRLSAGQRLALREPSARSVPLASIPASGRAAAAIRFAYAQLGKPYQWGAAGPGAYDCSGLTMAAWHAGGVSLPHSAQGQYGVGSHVATGALRPGDLVFFGSPIHHVGLYIGGGNMIAAPHTGDVVKIQPAIRGDLSGAARPA